VSVSGGVQASDRAASAEGRSIGVPDSEGKGSGHLHVRQDYSGGCSRSTAVAGHVWSRNAGQLVHHLEQEGQIVWLAYLGCFLPHDAFSRTPEAFPTTSIDVALMFVEE